MNQMLLELLVDRGMPTDAAKLTIEALDIGFVLVLALVSYSLANLFLNRALKSVIAKTKITWDDKLIELNVLARLTHVVPALVIHILAPVAFQSEFLILWTRRCAEIYALLAFVATFYQVLNFGLDIYNTFETSKRFPIRIYLQGIKIIMAAGAIIVTIAILTGQSPLLLLSGLGAMTAIILLVLRDSIQGLVAGIQLVNSDMLRVGDWLEMPSQGADGDVLEISLYTVRVQNWDKTITTVPTYKLISESFKNWRGMDESDGRRIKRAIQIDVSSICFCSPEMIENFKKIKLLKDYIERKQSELAEYNKSHQIEHESVLVNGRRMTNLGTFRCYLVNYLREHPMINDDLTLIVRQLQSTENGIPMEVYAFSSDKNWVNYESIQSDIFDHIFASLPTFGLRTFQRTSGHDALTALSVFES